MKKEQEIQKELSEAFTQGIFNAVLSKLLADLYEKIEEQSKQIKALCWQLDGGESGRKYTDELEKELIDKYVNKYFDDFRNKGYSNIEEYLTNFLNEFKKICN